MKELATSQGIKFYISDEDFEHVSKYTWCAVDRQLKLWKD